MTSIRHKPLSPEDDPFLDAARDNILAVGWKRTTLTDVAKRAGVSRMTVYRRWPDMQSLLADLQVREWAGLVDEALMGRDDATQLHSIVRAVVATVGAMRDNSLFMRIVEIDPELLLPYLLERRGRSQDHVLDLLTRVISAGQVAGTVRGGDPALLGRALLLALHGFVISPRTMVDTGIEELDSELSQLVERYLQP
jgi:AcrR family transcriptional regulator